MKKFDYNNIHWYIKIKMGIMEFFGSLINSNIIDAIKLNFLDRIDAKHFFIDSNSIAHTSSQNVMADLDQLLKEILKQGYNKQLPTNDPIKAISKKYDLQEFTHSITHIKNIEDVVEKYVAYFTPHRVNQLIISEIINDITIMIQTFTPENVETFMLAFDGVPSKGKMMESGSRRLMMAFVSKYKSLILKKYTNYLESLPDFVDVFETHRIVWTRANITPGTEFMDALSKQLHDKVTYKIFTRDRPRMKLLISDIYEIGEGEKKILNYIRYHLSGSNDKIVVYSPDSDVVLYCLLMPLNNVKMLRHNQQTKGYDLINVFEFKENIHFYVNSHPNNKEEREYDRNRLVYDIVFLSTFFGNDFVPRIETINVKRSFQKIIDIYLTTLLSFENHVYLMKIKDGKKKINYHFLIEVVKKLTLEEEKFIEKNHLFNKYIKFGTIMYAFPYYDIDESNIVSIYQEFTRKYGELKMTITQRMPLDKFLVDKEFIFSLKSTIMMTDQNGITITTAHLPGKEFINVLTKYYVLNKSFPKLNINLYEYTWSINDYKHKQKIAGKNDYQIEVYKMENMLDEYHRKFNATQLDLSPNAIEDFYLNNFNVTATVKKNKLDPDTEKVVKHYLRGLLWVVEYYFNDPDYLNLWGYQYERAPLLYHIMILLESMDQSSLDDMVTELDKFRVTDINNFFNPLELLAFMTPQLEEAQLLLPPEIRNWMKTSEFALEFYPNISKFALNAFKMNTCSSIDCRSMPYLSKCNLHIDGHGKTQPSEDKAFISSIRTVKLSDKSVKLTKMTDQKFFE